MLFPILVFVTNVFAHVGGHGTPRKTWELKTGSKIFQANFIKEENGIRGAEITDFKIIQPKEHLNNYFDIWSVFFATVLR